MEEENKVHLHHLRSGKWEFKEVVWRALYESSEDSGILKPGIFLLYEKSKGKNTLMNYVSTIKTKQERTVIEEATFLLEVLANECVDLMRFRKVIGLGSPRKQS